MNPTELGKYLADRRSDKGLSIYRLSKLSGVSHSYISQLERGIKEQPSPEILKKLANHLGVEYSDIMVKAGYIEMHPLMAWLGLEDEEVDKEWQKKATDKIIDLLNEESISFNEKSKLILELIGHQPITELKEFLNQEDITFAGVPIDGYYNQRVLDVLNGLFWEDIQSIKREED